MCITIEILKLMPHICNLSRKALATLGWHAYAARAPLDAQHPSALALRTASCLYLLCVLWVICHVLFSFPSWSFMMALYRFEIFLLLFNPAFPKFVWNPWAQWLLAYPVAFCETRPGHGRKQVELRIRDRTWMLILTHTSNIWMTLW